MPQHDNGFIPPEVLKAKQPKGEDGFVPPEVLKKKDSPGGGELDSEPPSTFPAGKSTLTYNVTDSPAAPGGSGAPTGDVAAEERQKQLQDRYAPQLEGAKKYREALGEERDRLYKVRAAQQEAPTISPQHTVGFQSTDQIERQEALNASLNKIENRLASYDADNAAINIETGDVQFVEKPEQVEELMSKGFVPKEYYKKMFPYQASKLGYDVEPATLRAWEEKTGQKLNQNEVVFAISNILEGGLTSIANIVKGVEIGATSSTPYGFLTNMTDPQKEYMGDVIANEVQEAFPDDPDKQQRFFNEAMTGLGSTAPYVLGGALAGGSTAGQLGVTAAMGGMQNGAIMYQDAIDNGASPQQAWASYLIGTTVGLSEAVPITRFFQRASKITGGRLKYSIMPQVMKNIAGQGAEEMTQEMFVGVMNNLTAKELYDLSREVFSSDVFREGAIGAVIGGLMGGATGLAATINQRIEQTQDPGDKQLLEEAKQNLEAYAEQATEQATEQEPIPTEGQPQMTGNKIDAPEGVQESPPSTKSEQAPEGEQRSAEATQEADQGANVGQKGQVEEEVAQAEREVTRLENETTKLQSQLEKNLTENQGKMFDEGTEQSMFDDRAEQQRLVDEKQKELQAARETLKKAQEKLQRVRDAEGQMEITETPQEETVLKEGAKYTTVKTPEGRIITRTKDGGEAPRRAQRDAEYALSQEMDFAQGETAMAKMDRGEADGGRAFDTMEEGIANLSENPAEIALAIQSTPEFVPTTDREIKNQRIGDLLGKGAVNLKSWREFGDINKLDDVKYWVDQKESQGTVGGIDVIAQEASLDGLEVTPQDVVEFMEAYSNESAYSKEVNPIYEDLMGRFEEIVGFRPTKKSINLIAERYDQRGIYQGSEAAPAEGASDTESTVPWEGEARNPDDLARKYGYTNIHQAVNSVKKHLGEEVTPETVTEGQIQEASGLRTTQPEETPQGERVQFTRFGEILTGTRVGDEITTDEGTVYNAKAKDVKDVRALPPQSNQEKVDNLINRISSRPGEGQVPGSTSGIGFGGGTRIPPKNTSSQQFLDDNLKYGDEDVQKRIDAARKSTKSVTDFLEKIKDFFSGLVKSFKHRYTSLDYQKYGDVADALRNIEGAPNYAKAKAKQYLEGLFDPLTDEQKLAVMDAVILQDALNAIDAGTDVEVQLPFGFKGRSEVEAELGKRMAVLKAEPKAMEAFQMREQFMEGLHGMLQDAGILPKSDEPYKTYFHRRTLQYMEEGNPGDKALYGVRGFLPDPPKRGQYKGRTGSRGLDYSTNFFESEFKVVADALFDLYKTDWVNKVLDKYDQMPQVKEAANQVYEAELQSLKDRFGEDSDEYQVLKDQTRKWKDKWINENLPEGVSLFPASPGNLLFRSTVIPNEKMEQRIKDAINEAGATEMDVEFFEEIVAQAMEDVGKDVVMMGGKHKQYALPSEIAETLEKFGEPPKGRSKIGKFFKGATTAWKIWTLISPMKLVKYSLNNLSGDLDGMLALDPAISKKVAQAHRLISEFHSTGKITPEIDRALKYNVINSGITVQEYSDINDQKWAKAILSPKKYTFGDLISKEAIKRLKDTKNPIAFWFDMAQSINNYRENLLRMAAFLRAEELVIGKGQTNTYWASNPYIVDAIDNPEQKAARIARDVLGDYGNISEAGESLRNYLMPFYSWKQINMSRFYWALKNASDPKVQERVLGILVRKGFTKAAAKLFVTGVQMSLLTGAIKMWNKLMFPDCEEKMRVSGVEGMQMIIGKDCRTLPIQGALQDALQFFGLKNGVEDVADLLQGEMSGKEFGTQVAKAPPTDVINSITPLIKTPFEVAFGLSAYPDPFNPMPKRDRVEMLLKVFQLDSAYRWMLDRPVTHEALTAGSLLSLFTYDLEPDMIAYYNTKRLISNYFGGGFGKAGKVNKAKSDALYYYGQALRKEDYDAADKYLKEYYEHGGSEKGLKTSLRNKHPLHGLPKEVKEETQKKLKNPNFRAESDFVKSLTARDLDRMQMAIDYYDSSFGAILKQVEGKSSGSSSSSRSSSTRESSTRTRMTRELQNIRERQ